MLAHPLARHLVAILTLKGVALLLLYFAFFSPAHRPIADSTAVATAVFGAAPMDHRRSLP